MAKHIVTAVTLLFFFFSVSHARRTLIQTEKNDAVKLSTDSDKKTTDKVLLPSEKSESESNVVPESTTESKILESTEPKAETTPLTVISFRPLNRQFSARPLTSFRHRHNCRHGQRHMRPWVGGPRFHPRDFSYVNDMLLAQDEGFDFDPVVADARPIRSREIRFNLGQFDQDRFPSKKDNNDKDLRRKHDDIDDKRENMGGFLTSKIRKFLGQF